MKPFHLSIVRHTQNYQAMLNFYGQQLGFLPTRSWDKPGNRGTLFAIGGDVAHTVVEVLELGEEAIAGGKPVNLVLSIEVDRVDDWHDWLVRSGVEIAREIEDAPWGHRSFGIDDPDGLRIWFYQDIGEKD